MKSVPIRPFARKPAPRRRGPPHSTGQPRLSLTGNRSLDSAGQASSPLFPSFTRTAHLTDPLRPQPLKLLSEVPDFRIRQLDKVGIAHAHGFRVRPGIEDNLLILGQRIISINR